MGQRGGLEQHPGEMVLDTPGSFSFVTMLTNLIGIATRLELSTLPKVI